VCGITILTTTLDFLISELIPFVCNKEPHFSPFLPKPSSGHAAIKHIKKKIVITYCC
jgi:hypothetical protein